MIKAMIYNIISFWFLLSGMAFLWGGLSRDPILLAYTVSGAMLTSIGFGMIHYTYNHNKANLEGKNG